MTVGDIARILGRRAALQPCAVSPFLRLWLRSVVQEVASLRPWPWMYSMRQVTLDSGGSYTFSPGVLYWVDVDFKVVLGGTRLTRAPAYDLPGPDTFSLIALSDGSYRIQSPSNPMSLVDVYGYFLPPIDLDRDSSTHPVLIYCPALVVARLWWELAKHLGRQDASEAAQMYSAVLELTLRQESNYGVVP